MISSIARDKRRVGWFYLGVLFVAVSCLVYWGNGNHLAVEVPVVDGERIQQLEAEKISLQRKVADLAALNKNLAAQIKTRNYVIAQYESQLKAQAVSVPPQPVILEAVRKEVSTPAGFDAMVKRTFGPIRVRVIE